MNTYIARVFYIVFSTYLGSNAAEKWFIILIAFPHIAGLLIYLELKIKNSFLKNYQKNLWLATMIFEYIFINRIQPFEAANI